MSKLVIGVNDLATAHPELTKEWHPTKNGNLKPKDVSSGSNSLVWWIDEFGHEWQATPHNRSKGTGCPICAGKIVVPGVNDLASQYPELLDQWDFKLNKDISPNQVYKNSNLKVWWKCPKCGHSWFVKISDRTRKGNNCPCCSNKTVVKGFNDLKTRYPFLADEWDYERNSFGPDEIVPGSQKKVWWKCLNGHESYLATPYNRIHGAGCPLCNQIFQTSFPEQAIFYYIKRVFPDCLNKFKNIFDSKMELDIYIPSKQVAIEYDGAAWHNEKTYEKELRKYLLCKQHRIFLYRIKEEIEDTKTCDKCFVVPKFTYENSSQLSKVIETIVREIDKKSNILVDINKDLFDILQYKKIKFEGSLEFLFPDVAKEWHPTKNGSLEPSNVLPGTSLKVWWLCSNGHEWKASVVNRTKGHGCDICANERRKITYHNKRLQTRDLLVGCKCVEDWDYTKNEHGPEYYTKGSGEKVWWKCHKCGHEWKTAICDRTRDYKNGCPACSNRILVRGKNDLQTTNPDLVREWDFERNKGITPSDVAQWTHKKYWWKCPKCGYSYEATSSNRVLGKGCPCCAGRVVVKGINDLATTRPDIAIDWHPTKNGNLKPCDVTKGRRDKIWWKCHVCGHEWQDTLNHRNRGRGCSDCKRAIN